MAPSSGRQGCPAQRWIRGGKENSRVGFLRPSLRHPLPAIRPYNTTIAQEETEQQGARAWDACVTAAPPRVQKIFHFCGSGNNHGSEVGKRSRRRGCVAACGEGLSRRRLTRRCTKLTVKWRVVTSSTKPTPGPNAQSPRNCGAAPPLRLRSAGDDTAAQEGCLHILPAWDNGRTAPCL